MNSFSSTKYRIFFKCLLFWLLFILLNGLLNIPAFIGSLVQSDFFTDASSEEAISPLFISSKVALLLQLVGDFLLLFVPLLLFGSYSLFKKIYLPIASILYLLLLYYTIYYEGYQNLYSVHPIFEDDWIIVKEVLPTFFNELSVKKGNYLLIVLSFVAISVLLLTLTYYTQNLFTKIKNQLLFWLISACLVLVAFVGDRYVYSNDDETLTEEIELSAQVTPSKLTWIFPNIRKSSTFNRKDHLAHLKKRWLYDLYMNKKLVKKPNVYLLFIESYGAVATLAEETSQLFSTLAQQLEEPLQGSGWHIASNYSKSPVIGGRSWLALTTSMVGAQIEDQTQYNGLIQQYQTFPHMIDYFNAQGYKTVRASTMSSKNIDTMQMLTIPNLFWRFDERLLFTDIPYKGYKYDYYGGIPDQYTLGYLEESVLAKIDEPYFMTFITMSSHGPWSNAPPIVANWKQLDSLAQPFPNGRPPLGMSIQKYWGLMEYELKTISNFILKYGDDNSIFIVLGDHNPAGLEWKLYRRFNKWATPIHIISKDAPFVESFYQHGFTEGMQVDTSAFTIMRHMGLYSLLTRQLLENYGEESEVLPNYLPWGLRLK